MDDKVCSDSGAIFSRFMDIKLIVIVLGLLIIKGLDNWVNNELEDIWEIYKIYKYLYI